VTRKRANLPASPRPRVSAYMGWEISQTPSAKFEAQAKIIIPVQHVTQTRRKEKKANG